MKKILYLLAMAATLLFAAACNREADNPDPAFGGKTVEATLSVALGEAPATKAYADGTTATKLLFTSMTRKRTWLPASPRRRRPRPSP